MTWDHLWQGSAEWIYMFRLALSCLCGFIIGLERTKRQKEAGIRTHMIVAMGAALIMIVSKYGFYDILAMNFDKLDVDASRMGSTILTGISFLGAGIILQRSGAVRGLTTAAGVWVTGGVGVAIGAGMYAAGIACTVLLVFVQLVLKAALSRVDDHADNGVEVYVRNRPDALTDFTAWLAARGIAPRFASVTHKNDHLALTLMVTDEEYEDIVPLLAEYPEAIHASI